MPRCETCWTVRGRDLWHPDCLCMPNASVLIPSAFHAWNCTRLVPLHERVLDAPKEQERVFKTPRLEFGNKPEKPKRRNAQAK